MKILRNMILCTMLLGSSALVAMESKEPGAGKTDAVIAKIQAYNNKCTKEFAYGIFLRSLRDFTLGQPHQNKKKLAEGHALGLGTTKETFDFESYKTLREEHRKLGPTKRKKIYARLRKMGISLPENEILEKHFRAGDPLKKG